MTEMEINAQFIGNYCPNNYLSVLEKVSCSKASLFPKLQSSSDENSSIIPLKILKII